MKTFVQTITPESLLLAKELLERGLCVGVPTETVYGLAANALDASAVVRIYETKKRPRFDPLIVHVDPRESLESLAEKNWIDLSPLNSTQLETLGKLVSQFWPGPLTLILPRGTKIPPLVTSGLSTVAVRMPAFTKFQELLEHLEFPLAAPSANLFGRMSPTLAEHVNEQFQGKIPLVLDGGACHYGLESTVVRVSEAGSINILRYGALTREDLELVQPVSTEKSEQIESPGQSSSHYSPQKPLYLLDDQLKLKKPYGVLFFSEKTRRQASSVEKNARFSRVLTPSGSVREAARQFFFQLHEMDRSDAEILVCEPCPEDDGLGRAINDRLQRAVHHLH